MIGAFTDDGVLVGQAGFRQESRKKSRHTGSVIGMYVTPEQRGTGLGKRLLFALIEELRNVDGIEQVKLSVTHSNADARKLYLHAGFVPFGIEKNAIKVDGVYYDKEFMALTL